MRFTDIHAVTDTKVEPGQQRRINDGAERLAALGQEVPKIAGRLGDDRPIKRIGAVDRLDLHQGRVGVRARGPRHGAQGRGRRNGAAARHECAFVRACGALNERKRNIATEDDAAFARQPFGETACKRSDTRDRHDAEGDAGYEHVEAAQAALQFAQRDTQDRRQPGRKPYALGELDSWRRVGFLDMA